MQPAVRRQLAEWSQLARKRHRDQTGLCLVEGVRSVEAAVQAGAPVEALVLTEAAAAEPRVAALVARADAPAWTAAARDLERLGDAVTAQGVVAVVRQTGVAPAALAALPHVVVLDGVQDPGNVGAVIRAAAWFGVAGVLAGPGTADPFGPKAVRASMGGVWDVRVAAAEDLPAALDALREAGFRLWGADLEGEPARGWQPGPRAALVLGSEAHGLSAETAARLAGRVRIGGGGAGRGVESLNVAVAAGILLHAWRG